MSSPEEKVESTSIYKICGLPFWHMKPELAAVTLAEAVPSIDGVVEPLAPQAVAFQINGKFWSMETRMPLVLILEESLAKILICGIVEVEPPDGGIRTSN